jgi:hypothetical protein
MMEPAAMERFRREFRALARQANDAEGLAQALGLLAEAEDALADQARGLVGEGWSAAELARGLGVTRQAFHKRFIRRPRRGGVPVQVGPGLFD